MTGDWIKITELDKKYITNSVAKFSQVGIEFSHKLKADQAASLLLIAYEKMGQVFLEVHPKDCQDCPAVKFITNSLIMINKVKGDQLKEMGVINEQGKLV